MATNRSRRLRKKLHVDEFQELGFEVDIHWTAEAASEDMEALFWQFVTEAIEQNGLCFGGSDHAGFVYREGGTSTDEDRQSVEKWLAASPKVASFTVGPLEDAWYPKEA